MRPVSMSRVLAVVLPLVVGACANTEAALRNEKGEMRYCYLVHQGGSERAAAFDSFSKCLNDAGAAGFRRTNSRSPDERPANSHLVIPPSF